MRVLVIVFLTMLTSKSVALVDCQTMSQYAASYSREELCRMARVNGVVVTEEDKRQYAACFVVTPQDRADFEACFGRRHDRRRTRTR